ncbi:hypothetical protein [Apilactobacillus xinyiensis]|uniref:hypothetical protein n=1 Tax=Apilactobacillus xinyiensis TaxID=2841032 RepID=UPI001C7CCE02|nr:hypothetical protein [Apilactobacillus xinyiensis]
MMIIIAVVLFFNSYLPNVVGVYLNKSKNVDVILCKNHKAQYMDAHDKITGTWSQNQKEVDLNLTNGKHLVGKIESNRQLYFDDLNLRVSNVN